MIEKAKEEDQSKEEHNDFKNAVKWSSSFILHAQCEQGVCDRGWYPFIYMFVCMYMYAGI